MNRYISLALIAVLTLLVNDVVLSQVAEAGGNNSQLFNEEGYVKGITLARAVGLVELALGLASLIIAILAKKRMAKKGAKIAFALGLAAVVFSGIHFFLTTGAVFGSGSGKAGAILAFLLGLISIILSVLTLRSRNTN